MDKNAYIGCLLGTAVGDALGLPYEGLSARRGAKLFPDTARHHLLFGKGMVSDDTEQACFVAQAIIRADGDVDIFRKRLARSLRWWLLGLPAGVGFATLRAIIKLWLGISPEKSGVFSAGNGPAMRSPVIGVAYGHDPEKLRQFVRASTEITHSDPKAYYAALAVALAAYQSATEETPSAARFIATLRDLLSGEGARELRELLERPADTANGISGYSYHTVPYVLQTWFMEPEDFATGLQKIIRAGGDTDTAGAIYGGIVGARVGKSGIPANWLANIIEWPRSMAWVERLGEALGRREQSANVKCPVYFKTGVLLRNLVFLVTVLVHGFRRLAPPY